MLPKTAFLPNPRQKISNKIEILLKQSDSLFQMVHQKGLDVGMPRRIRDDIREMIQRLNNFGSIWENREARAKRSEFDGEIRKLQVKGDISTVCWKLEERLRERESDLDGARMIINDITIRFQHLDNELEKHETTNL